jgi:acetyltransferase-like isoleucine patch superfamily enzyme
VENDVSIGANATIFPGVVIHKGAKIGAGSVVTKDVPPIEVWVGNPAKVLLK